MKLTLSSKCDIIAVIEALCLAAFFCAISSAFLDISSAIMFASGSSRAKVIAMQPEPVPTSIIVVGFLEIAISIISSVSTRGIKVLLLT